MKLFIPKLNRLAALLLCVFVSFSTSVRASDGMDWQPTATEKLIRMPAKYIDASIERNFQQSSLASGIHALEAQIQMEVARMNETFKTLSDQGVAEVGGVLGQEVDDVHVALRHQFLTAKSNYLGLLNEKHQLSERVLHKKAALYQHVLKKLRKKKVSATDAVSKGVIEKQKIARARLHQAVGQVDLLLSQSLSQAQVGNSHSNNVKPSKYQREYSENLAKVQQLKSAIQQHSANETPLLGGESLNREQYLRYLLSNIDSELALLDQERLMLGYMAKLVALDAQALEHEIAYEEPDQTALSIKQQIRIANTADLFINQ